MSIHGYPSISYTFHDPHSNRYYTTYVTTDDAMRLQSDRQFATDIFYHIKSETDNTMQQPLTTRHSTQPSRNGQIHALPNQTIVYLPSPGSSPRWFTYYPTPVTRFVHPRKKKYHMYVAF